MKITVEVPDDVAQRPHPEREALGALAIAGYRSSALTHSQASRLLQLSRFEFDALIESRHVDDHAYDLEDLEEDLETLERLGLDGVSRQRGHRGIAPGGDRRYSPAPGLRSHGDRRRVREWLASRLRLVRVATWSLVDCSSILICQARGIRRVFTHDHHFEQAGFERLLK